MPNNVYVVIHSPIGDLQTAIKERMKGTDTDRFKTVSISQSMIAVKDEQGKERILCTVILLIEEPNSYYGQ